jgi:ABC-type transport system involved in multi-copper enzyme maturation permease subunit
MWRDTRRTIAAEWFKLRKSQTTPVGLLVYLAILAVLYFTYEVAAQQSFIGIASGFYIAGAVTSAATMPLAFVALLLVSFSVGREFSQGTVQMIWVKPISRGGWFMGKTITSACHVSVFVCLTFLITIVAAGLQFGFTDLMEKDYLIHAESALWWQFVLLAGLTWLAVIAVAVAAAIPALYLGSPGGAVTVSIVVAFMLQMASGWETVSPFLLSTYLAEPLQQFEAMSKGLPLPWTWGELVRTCLVGSIVWIGVCWLWAWQIVRRKEVLN